MTRPLLSGLVLFLLYALCAAVAALAARWLRRPIPSRWLALLALPPMFFLHEGFFQGRTPVPADHAYLMAPDPNAAATSVWSDDVARQFAPWAQLVRLAWKSGHLPQRDPWNGCGMALGANGQSSAYSPLTLAATLLPLPAAFTFWAAARLLLCLTGTWLWLAELGISRWSALFGAIAFSFSLSMTAWLQFPQAAVLCLWPWLLFAIERLREPAVATRACAFLTLVLLLMPLAGHIETVASACAFTGLWLAARWAAGDRERAGFLATRIALAALLALGLSAFSLLPQALAIRDSNRLVLMERPFWSPILSLRPHGPEWPAGLLTLLLPRVFGDHVTAPMIAGGAGAFPEMALGYFGIVGVCLAALVARPGSRRPPAEKALLLPLGFGLGAAIGLWPFAELASLPPGLAHMFPLRYLTWAALAGSALAAFELDRLETDLSRRRGAAFWAIAAPAAALASVAVSYARARPLYAAAGALDAQRHAYLLAAAALAAGVAVLAATARPRRFAAVGVPLLTLAAGAELFRQGQRLNRMSDPALLYRPTPLVEFLRSRPRPFRIAGEGTILFPNVGVFAGLEDVRTHDPVERRDYVEFLDAACGYDPGAYFKRIADVDAPALDFLNVRYLVSPPKRTAPSAKWKPVYEGPDGTVFENTQVLPRVLAPARVRVVRRESRGLLPEPANRAYGQAYGNFLRGIEWRREAVVLDDGTRKFRPASTSKNAEALVTDYAETADSVAFRLRTRPAGSQALLVTSLTQDGGWRAHDESGASLPVGRANGPFLALAAPAGDHRIRLDYSPPGFRFGSRVSTAFLLVAASLAARAARRRAGGA
ncbi:MAG: YfhO family protein [Acidobacteriota bacterium]